MSLRFQIDQTGRKSRRDIPILVCFQEFRDCGASRGFLELSSKQFSRPVESSWNLRPRVSRGDTDQSPSEGGLMSCLVLIFWLCWISGVTAWRIDLEVRLSQNKTEK